MNPVSNMDIDNRTAENSYEMKLKLKEKEKEAKEKKRSPPELKATVNKKPRKSLHSPKHAEKPQRATRREERRELMNLAKSKWEQLRPRSNSKEKSIRLIQELLEMLQGRIVEFVFRHDGSRIVQWMLGEGNEKQREFVMKELMTTADQEPSFGIGPFFTRLACDRFGSHLAFKMLRTANKKQRQVIFEKYLRGSTSELMRSRHGADVLDFAYQTTLNARAKAELSVEMLYGKERKLFDTVRNKLFDKPDDGGRKGSRNVFAHSLELLEESFRDVVVDSAGAVVNQLVDKENILRFEIVHAAIKDYLEVLVKSYPKERAQELASLLGPAVVHIAHTKPGVQISVQCVKLLDAKHRKKLVRGLKTHIRKLVEDEFGHRLIISLFEWVDDTRLVGTMIRTEMFSSSQLDAELNEGGDSQKSKSRGGRSRAEKKGKGKKETASMENEIEAGTSIDLNYLKTVCTHRYAHMALLNLLVGRESRYFNPDMYGFVWESIDVEKFGLMSKKDVEVRRKELRSAFEDGIREVMKREMRTLLMNHWSAAVVIGALLSETTSESVVDGIVSCLVGEEGINELAGNVCARKTLATIFKLGGRKTSCTVLDHCETEALRTLLNSKGCEPIGEQLVRSSGRMEVRKLLESQ
ncbi:Pumilio like protein [Gracilaria domingensis]|nr:Pumilio like protein [Gracilaria domingensis]